MNDYGKNIREARKKAGLTQKDLADFSGVAKITIQQYEAGKRQPRLEQLMKLADTMEINIDELLGVNPLPPKEVAYDPEVFSERIEVEKSDEIEKLASFLFLDELGYKLFPYPEKESDGILDSWNKRVLYDCRENKAYYVPWTRMNQIRENIIAYAKFQMNELLANAEIANDIDEYLEELRYYKEIPPLSKAEKE